MTLIEEGDGLRVRYIYLPKTPIQYYICTNTFELTTRLDLNDNLSNLRKITDTEYAHTFPNPNPNEVILK